ncbi:MAG: ABC transporter permease [Arenicellales bacterium]|nr:ABC transporter permease [Arenicellales bacterium]
MQDIYQATKEALILLLGGDPGIWEIVGISFSVSLQAILYITPLSLLLAFLLAFGNFRGRRILISTFHTFLAIPAVVVGLTVYIFLSRNGPLGDLGLLFSQTAMVIGQMILAFPIVVAMSHSALQSSDRAIWETAKTLGASSPKAMFTVMYEARFGLFAAVIAAFSRIIAEVGCSMMVGGNILHHTRNIPTAIALETSKGEFAQGIALGLVLLFLALALNLLLSSARYRLEMA